MDVDLTLRAAMQMRVSFRARTRQFDDTLVAQLRVTLEAIERFDAEISAASRTLPDYPLFAALPGAGIALAPRLLAVFGERR